MSEDDDWFEQALRDSSDEDGSDAPEDDVGDGGADEGETREDADDSGAGGDQRDRNDEPKPNDDPVPEEDANDGDGDPFAQEFGDAIENAPIPDVEDTGDGRDGFGGAGDGLGGMSGGEDFGGMSGGDPGGMGDDDFGFADFGGPDSDPDSDNFDDEDFESDIERVDVGIEGLDEMILGGVPENSLIATMGSAGSGKTTFGLQFLHSALDDGERGVYITLEETRDRIVSTADEKGWEFSRFVDEEKLAVIDLDPIEMANSLASIRNDLPRLVADFDAERLVLDSVSLLEMMYDRPSRRRSEVFEFTQALKQAGVTTMVTSEASEDSAYVSRYGIIEYLADAVFVLQYVRPDDFQETRLAVEIQKIRDANHSRETKPYEITNEGINVYRQANIF